MGAILLANANQSEKSKPTEVCLAKVTVVSVMDEKQGQKFFEILNSHSDEIKVDMKHKPNNLFDSNVVIYFLSDWESKKYAPEEALVQEIFEELDKVVTAESASAQTVATIKDAGEILFIFYMTKVSGISDIDHFAKDASLRIRKANPAIFCR